MDVPDKIAQLRRRFAQGVVGNRVRPSRDCNKDCGAYNVHIEPDDSARDQLAAAQAGLVVAEPTLLTDSAGLSLDHPVDEAPSRKTCGVP
jgi:hypothetical protein